MGIDIYGVNPTNEHNGVYFRNNVWWWHPLWEYVCKECKDFLTETDMQKGGDNSGKKVSKTKALKIGKRLKSLIAADETVMHQISRADYIKNLPLEDCDICDGTGYRKEPPLTGAGHKNCNACNNEFKQDDVPVGKRKHWDTNYPFNVENVAEFAEFCLHSGGFKIW